jgi:hypothetical protein
MELTRIRNWVFFIMLVRAGRCVAVTREQLRRVHR